MGTVISQFPLTENLWWII